MSREEPVHSVMAQIYVLDSVTQNWAPATFSVVQVTFYYDPATTRTRIIGMENNEAKVNSMILPGMTFMKPSETFGQWLDLTTNQLFGLNFTSVTDTDTFAATFKAAADGKRPGAAVPDVGKTIIPQQQTASSAPAPGIKSSSSNQSLNKGVGSVAISSQQAPVVTVTSASAAESDALGKQVVELTKKLQQKEAELQQRTQERDQMAANAAKADSSAAQIRSLQAENEALKAQIRTLQEQASKSAANAGLEQQLKSAKDDNARLKAALLQNSDNATQWKAALSKAEEDNKVLQEKVKKLEELQKAFASIVAK